jgi:hypothetical protein
MHNPVRNAASKFERGPHKETMSISLLGLLKYKGLMGTGFAHPKLKRKREIAPRGSIWLMGFRVSLRAFLAVGSPRKNAALPCAYSWTVRAKRRTGIFVTRSKKSMDPSNPRRMRISCKSSFQTNRNLASIYF